MKKVSLAVLLATLGGAAHAATADEVTCPAPGYYLNNDVCTICEVGYYCRGNNARAKCASPNYSDTEGQSACTECPTVDDEHKNSYFKFYWSWSSNAIFSTITTCRAEWGRALEHGTIEFSCGYSADTNSYSQPGGEAQCISPGRDNRGNSCDAGYWIDTSNPVITRDNISGTLVQFWTRSYEDMISQEFCVPVGRGYYSPANAVTRTACPKGTYSDIDTATSVNDCKKCPDGYTTPGVAAKSINDCKCGAGYGWHGDDCVPLCTAGATELRAGGLTFNMYPNEVCDSPAIHVELAGGTCCVHLTPGAAAGAVNLEYKGEVYHTTN